MRWRDVLVVTLALGPMLSPTRAASALSAPSMATAQGPQAPRAEVEAVNPPDGVRAGTTAVVVLRVHLPDGVHVQSDRPRDPSLIPTTLTLTPPPGVSVGEIVYPKPTDFSQPGQAQPLAVFDQRFSITVRLKVDRGVASNPVVVPARLRYQACDATACFPPRREETQWTLETSPRKR